MFSSRIPVLRSNRLARALSHVLSSGSPLDDMTASNPTTLQLPYPTHLLTALASPEGLAYAPAPFGLFAAREAVAAYLEQRGVSVSADRVILTASTSEAYSLLFKVLCDPADVVLVPRPSYPLVDHLTRLEAVVPSAYGLEYHGRWELDVDSLRRAIVPRARAVLIVTPNNPTGSYVTSGEVDAIRGLAVRHGLAIISDEVFEEYPLDDSGGGRAGQLVDTTDALTFTLGGLSKCAGLPQLKLGWVLVGGPERLVKAALARFEMVCDSYLSVATPVQLAVDRLLAQTRPVVAAIRERVRTNYHTLRQLAARFPACRVLTVEAGWYAVIQVPAIRSEEALALELLRRDGVLVHPGYFFDFPREAFVVVSLLPLSDVFTSAMTRVLARASRT